MILDLGLAFLAGLLSFASTCVLPLVPAYVAYMGATAAAPEATIGQRLKVVGNAALFVAGFGTAFVALGASFGLIGADLAAYRPVLLQIAGIALVLIGVALLVAAYSAGLGLPFLVAAALSGMLTRMLARVRGAYAGLNAVAAVFLIGMGVLIFANRLTLFNDFFPVVAVTTPFDSHFETGNPTPAPHGSVQVGKPAPDFTLTDVEGNTVAMSQLKGKPVLITFWATWCVPCRDELPLIRDEYLAHRDQGLAVVAIDFGNQSSDTIRSFWQSMNLQPAPVLDPEGKAADSYGVALSSSGLPVSVLVARDGTVSSYEPFPLTRDYLDPALAKILS